LGDVTLVNQYVVTFLAHCEADGIKLESCPLHIRSWIDHRKRRTKKRNTKDVPVRVRLRQETCPAISGGVT